MDTETVTKNGADKTTGVNVTISAPNFETVEFILVGTAPYVQHKFSEKAKAEMREKQKAGSTAGKGKKRSPKDFGDAFVQAQHISEEGWHGIPAPAFRNAMISACRIVGFTMTRAKLSIFALPDGIDKDDQTPLVRITKGAPIYYETPVRNSTGVCDLRVRAMWKPGWEAALRVQYDADQFTRHDVTNLLVRVGLQVGIGEGRPNSSKSNGQGWGLFDVRG